MIIFPAVTPEGLYQQDRRRATWDEYERRIASLPTAAERLAEMSPSPELACLVLEQVARVLETHQVPQTRYRHPLTLSRRVELLERAASRAQ